jgi:hypothetical protein
MLTLRRNTYYLPALSPPGILLHHAHYSGFFSNVICYGIYARYIVHGISEACTFTVILQLSEFETRAGTSGKADEGTGD